MCKQATRSQDWPFSALLCFHLGMRHTQTALTQAPSALTELLSRAQEARELIYSSGILEAGIETADARLIRFEAYCTEKALESFGDGLRACQAGNTPDYLIQAKLAESVSYIFTSLHPTDTGDSSHAKIKTNEYRAATQLHLCLSQDIVNVSIKLSRYLDSEEDPFEALGARMNKAINLEAATSFGFGRSEYHACCHSSEHKKHSIKHWDDSKISVVQLLGKRWQSDFATLENKVALHENISDTLWRHLPESLTYLKQALGALDSSSKARFRFVPLLQKSLLACIKCPAINGQDEPPIRSLFETQQKLEKALTYLLRMSWGDTQLGPTGALNVETFRQAMEELGYPSEL